MLPFTTEQLQQTSYGNCADGVNVRLKTQIGFGERYYLLPFIGGVAEIGKGSGFRHFLFS